MGGRYTGTPTDCNSCHNPDYARTTNPNHAAGNFPLTCQNCHTTSAWRPASVDHSRTRFPLTGAHTRVDWGNHSASFAVLHGDAANRSLTSLVREIAGRTESGFVVGGLTSSRGRSVQYADALCEGSRRAPAIIWLDFTPESGDHERCASPASPR